MKKSTRILFLPLLFLASAISGCENETPSEPLASSVRMAATGTGSNCVRDGQWYRVEGAAAVAAKGAFFGTTYSWSKILAGAQTGPYYLLARAYIPAKLSVEASGTNPDTAVMGALSRAETFFTGRALGSSAGIQTAILTSWTGTLNDFTAGNLGWHKCGTAAVIGCAHPDEWFRSGTGATTVTAKGAFFGTTYSWTRILSGIQTGPYYQLARAYIPAYLSRQEAGASAPADVEGALSGAETFFTGRALGSSAGIQTSTLTAWTQVLGAFNGGSYAGSGWPQCPPGTPQRIVAIDANARFQTMDGFGTTERTFVDPHLINPAGGPAADTLRIPRAAQDSILDYLYKGLELTRVRTSIQNPAKIDDPFRSDWLYSDAHIELLGRMRARGLTTWWHSPNNGLFPGTTPQQYVDFAMPMMRYWKAQGMEFKYWAVANEPSYINPMTGERIRDIIKLLGPAMRAEGISTMIVLGDDLNPQSAVNTSTPALLDPVSRQYVVAIGTHLYGWSESGMAELRDLARTYGIPLWMTEYSTGPALEWALLTHKLVTQYNVAAMDYMLGFFGQWAGDAHLVNILNSGTTYLGFNFKFQYYVMGQFSKFVRPGAVRVSATDTGDPAVSAYTKDGRLTIVAINNTSTPLVTRFDLAGVGNSSSFRIFHTSTVDRLRQATNVSIYNNSVTVTLPANGMTTLAQ